MKGLSCAGGWEDNDALRVTSSDLHVITITPAGAWRTVGGKTDWMRAHSVTQEALAGERSCSLHWGGRAGDLQKRENFEKSIWRMKQNRYWGLIGHGEKLVKDGMKVPGLGRLVMAPLREGALEDDPIWGGKIMRGAFFEVTLRHPTGGIKQAVGYTGPCLRQLTLCSALNKYIGWESGLLCSCQGENSGASGLPKQNLKTQGRSFPSGHNNSNFGSYHWTMFGRVC